MILQACATTSPNFTVKRGLRCVAKCRIQFPSGNGSLLLHLQARDYSCLACQREVTRPHRLYANVKRLRQAIPVEVAFHFIAHPVKEIERILL